MSENIDLFKFWIEQGWKFRRRHDEHMKSHAAQYKSRLKHEVDLIIEKDFVDYFLMVSDIIRWAKREGIAVGPGRGSAAGSLVCYLLRITEVNPMLYPMLFERFMDPTRTDEPDIDIDFEDSRRDEVFDYATRKYGKEFVANIGTTTRYLGKNSIDDVARVYHIPVWMAEAIKGKLLDRPEGHPRFSKSLVDTFDSFPEIAKYVEDRPELSYAAMLEGNIRSFGVHAAGMVISSVPLNEICATYQREINGRVAQAIPYDKRDAAKMGLLKIDILSLITMGEIANICRLAGMSLEELYRVPLDDKATLQAFRDGDVLGVFQFEGASTRRILRAVAPTTFMHLSDVNALSRPGADDAAYVENKTSGAEPDYAHPILAQHLSWTHGVVVYEEQILMILRDLGGFEPAELNRMRKVIHDKLGSTEFNKSYERFVKGAAAHGLSEDAAKSIWDGLVGASGYAFNIAHSVCYAHIGYWEQWLKVHKPVEFYATKLSKCSDSVRRGKFIQEAKRHGITVSPPKLLVSQHDWTITDTGEIVAGFQAIDGIGPKTAQNIIDWRESLSDTRDLDWPDLLAVKGIGKKTIEKIIDFVEADDPFGVEKTSRTLDLVRKQISEGIIAAPEPTHVSIDIPPEKTWVTYVGIVRGRKYYDAVEQLQKRTTENLSREDALAQLDRPDLLKYAALYVEDEYGESIRVSISRWVYPKFRDQIERIKMNTDVVVAQGYSNEWGGISIQVKNLFIINPEKL